jgi:uncharacterized membrane protein
MIRRANLWPTVARLETTLTHRPIFSARRIAVVATAFVALVGNAAAVAKSGGNSGGHGHGSSAASFSSTASSKARSGTPANSSGAGHGSTYSGAHYRNPPTMDSKRAVVEQDCSKPIAQISGNLRCK